MPPVFATVRRRLVYEHPWGTQAHALAELFLPGSIRNLFDTDIVTNTDSLVDQPSMQALAMGGELAFVMSQSSSCCKIALAVLPGKASLAVLLDAAFFVVVLRVVSAKLSVQLAL